MTATFAFILLRGKIGKVDKYTYCLAGTLPFATLGLYNGIRHWGAGPTMILLTTTPLINFAFGVYSGKKPSGAAVGSLFLLLSGVSMALWGGSWNWIGFSWTIFATLLSGILYECFARAKSKPLEKCFYSASAMGTLGLVVSLAMDASWTQTCEPNTMMTLVLFAFIGGFLYWMANLLAFENLPVAEASVLAQLETPAVILGESLFLGKYLLGYQWIGVTIALCGGSLLALWLAKQVEKEKGERQ